MLDFKGLGAGISGHLSGIALQVLIGLSGTAVLFPLLSSYIIEAIDSENHVVPLYIFAFLFFLLPTAVLFIWYRHYKSKHKDLLHPILLRKLNLQQYLALGLAGFLAVAFIFLYVGSSKNLNLALVFFQGLVGLSIYTKTRRLLQIVPNKKRVRRQVNAAILISFLLTGAFHFNAIKDKKYPRLDANNLNDLINRQHDLSKNIPEISKSLLYRLESLMFLEDLEQKALPPEARKKPTGSQFSNEDFEVAQVKVNQLSQHFSHFYQPIIPEKFTTQEAEEKCIREVIEAFGKVDTLLTEIKEHIRKGTLAFDSETNYRQAYKQLYLPFRHLAQRLGYESDKKTREQVVLEIDAMRDVGASVFLSIITSMYCLLLVFKSQVKEFEEVKEEDLTDTQKALTTLRSNLRVIMAFVIILGIPLLKATPPTEVLIDKPSSWVLNTNWYSQVTVNDTPEESTEDGDSQGEQTPASPDLIQVLNERIRVLEFEVKTLREERIIMYQDSTATWRKELNKVNRNLNTLKKHHKAISDGTAIE